MEFEACKNNIVPKDLIVFGEDWGGHPSSTQYLVKLLARNRRVLWVNSIGLRRPKLNFSDFRRLLVKFKAMIKPFREMSESNSISPVHVVQPKAFPFPGNRLARMLNRRLLMRLIKPAIVQAGLKHPVLWVSLPTAVDMIGELNECAVVYYCGDDFGALSGVDHKPVLKLEEELASKADLILAASPVISKRFKADKTHVITHGVNFDLFSKLAPRASDLPVKGPVAGFYGSLADWLDIDLICDTARSLPHWTFVFIGAINTDVSKLQIASNILLLGPRNHNELAEYSQHWNASLLPFRDTEQIRACNPLKLREYLAAGSPIISTDFPALDGYRDLITVVKTADDFSRALIESLDDHKLKRVLRKERVSQESWEARAQAVAELIDNL